MVVLNDDDFQRIKEHLPSYLLENMVIYENVWIPFKLTKSERIETRIMPDIVWEMFLEFTAEYEDGEFCTKEILKKFHHELNKLASSEKSIAQYLETVLA